MTSAFDLHNLSSRHKRALALSLMITAGAYLLAVLLSGADKFGAIATTLGGGWLVLLGASLSSYLLRFVRWNYYMHILQHQIPVKLHIYYYLAGFALTTTPGKAGEIIRSLYLKAHAVPYRHSLACFFSERFLDVITVSILAALIFRLHSDYNYFMYVVFIVLTALLLLIQSQLPQRWLHRLARYLARSRLVTVTQQLADLLTHARRLLTGRCLYTGVFIGLLAWSIQGLAFYYLVKVSGFELSLPAALAIYALSLLAGAASFIPGGIGATETVMGVLLLLQGLDAGAAVSIPVINRITTLWFAVALGLLANAWLGWRGLDIHTDNPAGS